jgi:hypothetical protein
VSAHNHDAPAFEPPGPFKGGRSLMLGAAVVGVLGLILTGVGGLSAPRETLFSYLFSFVYWVGLSVASLILLLIWHTANARWPVAVRRLLEHHASAVHIFVVLFLPIVLGMKHIFVWVAPHGLPRNELETLHHKAPYLSVGSFLFRAAIYFLLWIVVSHLLRAWSMRQDVEGGAALTIRQRRLGAGALPFVGLAISFAAFDWLMSLDPIYASTIFGLYYFAGSFLGAIAILIIVAWQLTRRNALGGAVTVEHFHSLGMFLLAFTCFWAYMAYSQGLLNWVANLPHETRFYLQRSQHGFGGIGLFLIGFHFIVPFFILLSRPLKRTPQLLQFMALWMLVVHAVDIYWIVMPALGATAMPHWTVFTSFAGIGGLTIAFALFRMRDTLLVPVGDPYLEQSVRYQQP